MKKALKFSALVLSLSPCLLQANGKPAPIPSSMPGVSAPGANSSALGGATLGVQLGYSIGSTNLKESEVRAPFRSASTDITSHGLIGGLNFGYGSFSNNLYLGVEGEVNFSNLSSSKSSILILGGNTLSHNVKLDASADLVARVGLLYKDNIMPYIKGGLTVGRWKAKSTQQLIGTGSDSSTRLGFVVGAGSEVAISKYTILASDYSYKRYSALSYNVGAAGIVNRRVKVTPGTHNLMVRLKYKIAT